MSLLSCCDVDEPTTVELVKVEPVHPEPVQEPKKEPEPVVEEPWTPAPAPEPEPEELPSRWVFQAEIRTGGRDLGLVCDAAEAWQDGVQIVKVIPGRISDYNAAAPEREEINEYDFIIEANGEKEGPQILEILKNHTQNEKINLTVAHPSRQAIKVRKSKERWGLDMIYQPRVSSCLRVKKILEDSSFDDHNRTVEIEHQVRERDYIAKVNNTAGSAKHMDTVISNAQDLEIEFLRLP